ncbi:M-phase phosphoprotein 6 isoform X2 [Hydra vulgaris]|uniref:M-phase phosphoprotein 6 isoform X2 n=1 Tax=Hydra vulgaris TaxID=6087 RepID=UPI001F5F1836|nr:M-phase phosphoprotein 6 isoform X2 [Hydra vulgaris]
MAETSRGVDDTASRRSLSKNVLQMKFMQRNNERFEADDQFSQHKQQNDDTHWVMLNNSSELNKMENFEFGAGYVLCEELLPIGRMSFMNYNPLVQKVHQEIVAKVNMRYSDERENFDQISDRDMAERYESLVDTIGKKFQKSKRKFVSDSSSDSELDENSLTNRAKRGFLKPKVD